MNQLDTSTTISVEINKAKEYIKSLVTLSGLNQSIYLEGPSGIGKSDIIKQLAIDLELELIDLRLGNQDIVSLSGIGVPNLEDKTAYFTRPDFFPPENSKIKYLLFLDEFNHASKSVFSAAYQLVLERRMNDHILPENILIIAAGNSISDKGVAFSMPSPLVNRFLHINVVSSAESWLKYAESKDLDWKLRGLIKGNPSLLHKFDPKSNEDNFPTPRNWVQCNPFFDIKDETLRKTLLNGKLGYTTMVAVEQHLRLLEKLPNIKLIINGKGARNIDSDLTSSYSFSLLIKNYIKNHIDTLTAEQLFNVFSFINEQENKEVMEFLTLELSALINTTIKNTDVLDVFHLKIINSEIQFKSTKFIKNLQNFNKRMAK